MKRTHIIPILLLGLMALSAYLIGTSPELKAEYRTENNVDTPTPAPADCDQLHILQEKIAAYTLLPFNTIKDNTITTSYDCYQSGQGWVHRVDVVVNGDVQTFAMTDGDTDCPLVVTCVDDIAFLFDPGPIVG